jgi:hypothetical protein
VIRPRRLRHSGPLIFVLDFELSTCHLYYTVLALAFQTKTVIQPVLQNQPVCSPSIRPLTVLVRHPVFPSESHSAGSIRIRIPRLILMLSHCVVISLSFCIALCLSGFFFCSASFAGRSVRYRFSKSFDMSGKDSSRAVGLFHPASSVLFRHYFERCVFPTGYFS